MKTIYITIILLLSHIFYAQNNTATKESIYFNINCKSELSFLKIKKEKKQYRISFHVNGDSIAFLGKKIKFTKKNNQTKFINCNEMSKLSMKQYINIMENKIVYIFKNNKMFYLVHEMTYYERGQD